LSSAQRAPAASLDGAAGAEETSKVTAHRSKRAGGAPVRYPGRRFKDAIYEQFARVSKALASPHRMELLDLLAQGPRTVEALARMAGMTLANTSAHLQVLRGAGLLESTKEGLFVTYRVAHPKVAELFLAIRSVAEARIAEVERATREFLAENELLEPIDETALRKKVRSGEVTVLDVRPREEFETAHLPGALSVPLPELAKRLSELPRRREVVAYCRGPYCVLAVAAVKLLRSHGFKAVRLEDGVLDWAALGLPLETTPA
jgi:rhodanese-related sulfurtransferase